MAKHGTPNFLAHQIPFSILSVYPTAGSKTGDFPYFVGLQNLACDEEVLRGWIESCLLHDRIPPSMEQDVFCTRCLLYEMCPVRHVLYVSLLILAPIGAF
jgi:hypothetical protein